MKLFRRRLWGFKLIWCIVFSSVILLFYKKSEIEQRIAEKIIATTYAPLRSVRTIDEFYQFLERTPSACKNVKQFGGSMAQSDMALHARSMCGDIPFHLDTKNCIVLSFGMHNDTSFEKALVEHGCMVHGFNPNVVDYKIIKENFQNYALRLSNATDVKFDAAENRTIQTERYFDALKMLNLTTTRIDYLHVDLESLHFEWLFFDEVFENNPEILKNVKQIGMEVHLEKYEGNGQLSHSFQYQSLWRYFHNLAKLGFLIVDYRPHKCHDSLYEWKDRNLSMVFDIVWGQYQINIDTKDYYRNQMILPRL